MEEVKVITLEDNKKYIILDELVKNDETYLLMALETNLKEFCIRKLKKQNDKDYIVSLDSEEEFKNILNCFSEKLDNEN